MDAALPLADALLAGGLPIIEITFRTAAARAAIERIASRCPELLVGAGTVLSIDNLRAAVDSGARFFQTQAVFERRVLERFSAAMQPLAVPVIAGVLLVRSGKMARFLNDNIPGVQVPGELVERLDRASDPVAEGVAIARETVAWARELCQGVHLMTLGHEDQIPAILA